VIGTGRMGRLHARTYAKMPQVNLVGVYDMNADAASDVAGELRTQPFSDVGEVP
jgi:predicted dehydrogenase